MQRKTEFPLNVMQKYSFYQIFYLILFLYNILKDAVNLLLLAIWKYPLLCLTRLVINHRIKEKEIEETFTVSQTKLVNF